MSHPFQRWVDAARPGAELWRTLAGTALAIVAWVVVANVVAGVAVWTGMIRIGDLQAMVDEAPRALTYRDAVFVLGVGLATFAGLWVGVWAALKVLHKRSLGSLISFDGRIKGGQFLAGAGLAAGYLIASMTLSYFSGGAPQRSTLPVETWLVALAPLVLLIVLQSAGEELLFRGYLVQQLAARVNTPLVWGLAPALAFGLAHVTNGRADAQFTAYYIFAAVMLGLVMTATVWRTGALSAAIGFHVVNNIGAMLVVGLGAGTPPVSLFVLSYGDVLALAPTDLLVLGLLLAFVLSPYAPLPRGQALRRKDTRAAP
jgi:hypothetical protein